MQSIVFLVIPRIPRCPWREHSYFLLPHIANVNIEVIPDGKSPVDFVSFSETASKVNEETKPLTGAFQVRFQKEGRGKIILTATNPNDNDKQFARHSISVISQEAEVQIKLKDLKSDGNFSRIDTDAEGNSSLVISDGERVDFKIDSNVELKDLKVEYVPNDLSDAEGVKFKDKIFNFEISHPVDYMEQLYIVNNKYHLYYKDDEGINHLLYDLERVNFKTNKNTFDSPQNAKLGTWIQSVNGVGTYTLPNAWMPEGPVTPQPYTPYYKLTFKDGFNVYIDEAAPYGTVDDPMDNPMDAPRFTDDRWGGSVYIYPKLKDRQKHYPTEILEKIFCEKGAVLEKPLYFTQRAFKNSMFFIEAINVQLYERFGATFYFGKKYYLLTNINKSLLSFPKTEFIPLEKSDKKIGVVSEKKLLGFIRMSFTRFGVKDSLSTPVYLEFRNGCFKNDYVESVTVDFESEKLMF
ncbi:MAG: hypothetical protein P1P64_07420 [Treponemataceae bacterium]